MAAYVWKTEIKYLGIPLWKDPKKTTTPAYSRQHATICLMASWCARTTDGAGRGGSLSRSQGYEGCASHYRSSCCRLGHLRSHLFGETLLKAAHGGAAGFFLMPKWLQGHGRLRDFFDQEQKRIKQYLCVYVILCVMYMTYRTVARVQVSKERRNRKCWVKMASCA